MLLVNCSVTNPKLQPGRCTPAVGRVVGAGGAFWGGGVEHLVPGKGRKEPGGMAWPPDRGQPSQCGLRTWTRQLHGPAYLAHHPASSATSRGHLLLGAGGWPGAPSWPRISLASVNKNPDNLPELLPNGHMGKKKRLGTKLTDTYFHVRVGD